MEVSDCMPALISSAPHLIPCGHLAVWLKAVSRERVAATLCASLLRCWQIQCWFLSPRFWCSRCVTLAHTLHSFTLRMLVQIISGRGPPHFHMHVTKEQGHVVQKFLAELLYSDMALFSSVIASSGYSALNLNETQTAVTTSISISQKVAWQWWVRSCCFFNVFLALFTVASGPRGSAPTVRAVLQHACMRVCVCNSATRIDGKWSHYSCSCSALNFAIISSTLDTDGRWSIFFAYLVVVMWNLLITLVVLWLYLRQNHSVAGLCRHYDVAHLWRSVIILEPEPSEPCRPNFGADCSGWHFAWRLWKETQLGLFKSRDRSQVAVNMRHRFHSRMLCFSGQQTPKDGI